MRNFERQLLRNPPSISLKTRINGCSRFQVTCVSHSIVGNPEAINESFPIVYFVTLTIASPVSISHVSFSVGLAIVQPVPERQASAGALMPIEQRIESSFGALRCTPEFAVTKG